MRLLAVADLHYSLPQFDWVLEVAPDFDVVVLAGDMLELASIVDRRAQAEVQHIADDAAGLVRSRQAAEPAIFSPHVAITNVAVVDGARVAAHQPADALVSFDLALAVAIGCMTFLAVPGYP